jgi:hypothetical protein
MSVETAQLVLYAVAAVAAVVWLSGLRLLLLSARLHGQAVPRDSGWDALAAASAADRTYPISGEAEVEGEAGQLAEKLARVLARPDAAGAGAVKITECSPRRVSFEGLGGQAAGQGWGPMVRRGVIDLEPAARQRTRLSYGVEPVSGRWLLVGAAIFQTLGLVALVVGFLLIDRLVVPNPNPAVRGQVFQSLQIVHFLWPPFLFAGLYRTRYRLVRAGVDALVHNVPYQDD